MGIHRCVNILELVHVCSSRVPGSPLKMFFDFQKWFASEKNVAYVDVVTRQDWLMEFPGTPIGLFQASDGTVAFC